MGLARFSPKLETIRETGLLALAYLALLLVGLGTFAATKSLWMDDLFSLTTSEEPYGEMLTLLREYHGGFFDHPPLYFLLLRQVLFYGNSPFVLRVPSLVFAALAAAVVAIHLARMGFPRWQARSGALLFLCLPIVLDMAVFVRMYGLFLLQGTLLTYLVWQILLNAEDRWRRAGYLALVLASALYTSYFSLLLAGGLGALGLWQTACDLRKPGWKRGAGVAILAGAAVAVFLYLPWIPTVLRMLGHETTDAPPFPGRKTDFLRSGSWRWGGGIVGLAVLIPGIVSAGWLAVEGWRRKASRDGLIAFQSIVYLFVLPALVLMFFAPPHRILQPRYLIFAMPVIWTGVFAGYRFLLEKKTIPPQALTAIFLAAGVLNFGFYAYREATEQGGWWVPAQILEEQAQPHEIIMTGAWLSGEAIVYHLERPEDFSFLHYQFAIDEFYLGARNPRVVWYVNEAYLPEIYTTIVRAHFPYRINIDGWEKEGQGIWIYAKKPFSHPDGTPAEYHEAVPLAENFGDLVREAAAAP